MLCMSLWRQREYPVDKLASAGATGASKGLRRIDFALIESLPIKKYYFVKKFIKFLNRDPAADPNGGLQRVL